MSHISSTYQASSVNSYYRTKIGADYYDEVADAKERQEYYAPVADSFEKSDPKALFNKLHQLVSNTFHPTGKLPADDLYSLVDRRPDGALYYLYSGEGPKNEEQAPQRNPRDLEGYNLEHVVPKSWFDDKLPMRDDLHHLFTENRQCNSDRGNLPLREVKGKAKDSCGEGKLTDGAFEPKGGKGEVARAILYFVTRHPGEVGDARGEMTSADIPTLLKWSKEYPVTDYERHRNETIQSIQGNRNPFIDFPKLAEKVDFSAGFGS